MNKDNLLKGILSNKISMTPVGTVADQLPGENFHAYKEQFFDKIIEISRSDISSIHGYGELNDNLETQYNSCHDYMIGTFAEDQEGYWYHWKEIFHTTILTREFFEKYYNLMLEYIPYCENKRYLTYNNAFFVNMVIDENEVGFPDWSRAGIMDWLMDIAIMDLNKPYLNIIESFYDYCNKHSITVDHIKERLLCLSYFKGIDVLRWHASIDDVESCESIMKSINELTDRINKL